MMRRPPPSTRWLATLLAGLWLFVWGSPCVMAAAMPGMVPCDPADCASMLSGGDGDCGMRLVECASPTSGPAIQAASLPSPSTPAATPVFVPLRRSAVILIVPARIHLARAATDPPFLRNARLLI